MSENYYLVLGVDTDATEAEIKSAYRRRALECHPDRSGADAESFLQLQEAYRRLGGQEGRQAHDERLRARRAEPLRAPRHEVDPRSWRQHDPPVHQVSLAASFEAYHPSFEELFDRWWGNFGVLTRPKAEGIASLTVEVPLTPAQAFWGGHVEIGVPVQEECPTCRGRGAVGPFECWRCTGHGAIVAEFPLAVEYPEGTVGGYVVRIPLGRFGIQNLYLTVRFVVTASVG